MNKLIIHQFECLSDNYGVLIHDPETNQTASIDAPDAMAIKKELENKKWKLTHILVTHKHLDHIGGLDDLKKDYNPFIIGPKYEEESIELLDKTVLDQEFFDFANRPVKVIHTPGHTLGHIVYWIENDNLLFAGDTIFAMGCGRVFEGSHDQMLASLNKIKNLPENTIVYCGHEYTIANANFALSIEPNNKNLCSRIEQVKELRSENKPTLPTTIRIELDTNPFLRTDSPEIQRSLNLLNSHSKNIFSKLRTKKDSF
jgi:hydroxyacylglutathione hydrolase